MKAQEKFNILSTFRSELFHDWTEKRLKFTHEEHSELSRLMESLDWEGDYTKSKASNALLREFLITKRFFDDQFTKIKEELPSFYMKITTGTAYKWAWPFERFQSVFFAPPKDWSHKFSKEEMVEKYENLNSLPLFLFLVQSIEKKEGDKTRGHFYTLLYKLEEELKKLFLEHLSITKKCDEKLPEEWYANICRPWIFKQMIDHGIFSVGIGYPFSHLIDYLRELNYFEVSSDDYKNDSRKITYQEKGRAVGLFKYPKEIETLGNVTVSYALPVRSQGMFSSFWDDANYDIFLERMGDHLPVKEIRKNFDDLLRIDKDFLYAPTTRTFFFKFASGLLIEAKNKKVYAALKSDLERRGATETSNKDTLFLQQENTPRSDMLEHFSFVIDAIEKSTGIKDKKEKALSKEFAKSYFEIKNYSERLGDNLVFDPIDAQQRIVFSVDKQQEIIPGVYPAWDFYSEVKSTPYNYIPKYEEFEKQQFLDKSAFFLGDSLFINNTNYVLFDPWLDWFVKFFTFSTASICLELTNQFDYSLGYVQIDTPPEESKRLFRFKRPKSKKAMTGLRALLNKIQKLATR